MSDAIQYYECHITLVGDPRHTQTIVERYGWSFSEINGDPVEGAGVKCYATKHFNAKVAATEVVIRVSDAAEFFRLRDCTVTREKVERVIYDTRSAKVRPHD